MIKNHFPTVKIIETTLAKILDKLAKFSKLNFLAIGVTPEFGENSTIRNFVE